MSDQANDVTKQYQAWAQQSWDAWMRSLQFAAPQHAPPPASDDLLSRALGGLKSYADWLQAAATGGLAGVGQDDWQSSLRQLFTGASQPFAQAFVGIDNAAAHGFAQQWQSWQQAVMQSPFGASPAGFGDTPAFGYTRERQQQQQALADAIRTYLDTSARYQALILRANAEGFARLQAKLGTQAEPGRQVESLKALYDLWVDAVEDAYAEIALSDEFREVYGAMVNAQMHVRQLQQKQVESVCRELGMPTRSEIDSLGKRVQELRREWRVASAGTRVPKASADHELEALRAEVAALKRKLASKGEAAPQASKKVVSDTLGDGETKRKPAARRSAKTVSARGTQRTRK